MASNRVTLVCSADEMAVLSEMQQRGAFDSVDSLLRAAIWEYAKHLDVDVPVELFPGHRRPRRKTA